MGSLLTDMSISDGNSTWQVLGEHGVDDSHLHFLRKYRRGFAEQVAELIKSGPRLFATAVCGDLSSALSAVNQIEDTEILKSIYQGSVHLEVWIAVISKIADLNEIYHLVRIYDTPDRRVAMLTGARRLNRHALWNLSSDDGYQNPRSLAIRRSVVREVLRERGEELFRF